MKDTPYEQLPEGDKMCRIFLTPRHQRDGNLVVKDEFLPLDPCGQPLMFDSSEATANRLFSTEGDLGDLEKSLWAFLIYGIRTPEKRDFTQRFFGISQEFRDLIEELTDQEVRLRFGVLSESIVLSFAPSQDFQRRVSDVLNSGTHQPMKDAGKIDMGIFATYQKLIGADQEFGTLEVRCGFTPAFACALRKARPAAAQAAFLSQGPLEMRLRCSEDVAAAILACESERDMPGLLAEKFAQIASESMNEAVRKSIASKFDRAGCHAPAAGGCLGSEGRPKAGALGGKA